MQKRISGMTELQRKYVFDIGDEIRKMPGGKHIRVYASMGEIVRMQHEQQNKHYRLLMVGGKDRKKDIRERMYRMFDEIRQAAGQ